MEVTIRDALPDDLSALAWVHSRAVHQLARGHYPPAQLRAWAPEKPGAAWIAGFRQGQERGRRVVALGEHDQCESAVLGFAELAIETQELRACYVLPAAARQGVGRALVRHIEAIAGAAGLDFLWLDASLNAEPFYRALGYEMVARGSHRLDREGLEVALACVKMRKAL